MEPFIVFWCLEVFLLFRSQWVYVVMMVRDCLWFIGGEVYHWFTCSDTLSPSNVSASSSSTSRLANSVESANINKYSISHLFPLFPSCVETLGAWGSQYKRSKSRLGVYLKIQTGLLVNAHGPDKQLKSEWALNALFSSHFITFKQGIL